MKYRARQILEMKAQGKLTKQIADELGLHVRTVEFHLSEAKLSLKAKNVYHAVAIAVRDGLIFISKLLIVITLANGVLDPDTEVRRARTRPIRVRNTRRKADA